MNCPECGSEINNSDYINRYELVDRLEKRMKLYAKKMVEIENNDTDFLNNRGYINLTASCFELQSLINLIEKKLI